MWKNGSTVQCFPLFYCRMTRGVFVVSPVLTRSDKKILVKKKKKSLKWQVLADVAVFCLQIDNKGNHLLVSEEASINVPAIAAAHVTKRYTAQATDELTFEVTSPSWKDIRSTIVFIISS